MNLSDILNNQTSETETETTAQEPQETPTSKIIHDPRELDAFVEKTVADLRGYLFHGFKSDVKMVPTPETARLMGKWVEERGKVAALEIGFLARTWMEQDLETYVEQYADDSKDEMTTKKEKALEALGDLVKVFAAHRASSPFGPSRSPFGGSDFFHDLLHDEDERL